MGGQGAGKGGEGEEGGPLGTRQAGRAAAAAAAAWQATLPTCASSQQLQLRLLAPTARHPPAQTMRKARGHSPAKKVPAPSVLTMWLTVDMSERYCGCVALSGKACRAARGGDGGGGGGGGGQRGQGAHGEAGLQAADQGAGHGWDRERQGRRWEPEGPSNDITSLQVSLSRPPWRPLLQPALTRDPMHPLPPHPRPAHPPHQHPPTRPHLHARLYRVCRLRGHRG